MNEKRLKRHLKNFNVMDNAIKQIENFLRFGNCPLCHSMEISKVGIINYPMPVAFSDSQILVKNQPEYWHCQSCFSYFTQNIISEEKAMELYSDNKSNKWNYTEFEKDKTADFTGWICNLIKRGDSVLDIGCNDGNFLNFAKKNGANTFGVEYSRIGREVCEKNGHKVWETIAGIPDDLKFDFIFAFDLVEHLYNIREFFESCRHLLKPSGRLVILTGNPNCFSAKLSGRKWWYINNPEHLIFPSEKFFSSIAGFRLEKYQKIFNSRGYYLISVHNPFKPLNIIKIAAKLLLKKYDGTPLLDKDHALAVLKKN